jgi:hypothetical protein
MNKASKIELKNRWYLRILSLIIASLAILGSAASCGLPGTNSTPISLGVLKRDPAVRAEGFGRINAVNLLNGQTDGQGLAGISGLKILQIDSDNLFLLTKQKGLFKSTEAGRTWKRQYIFTLPGTDTQDRAVQEAITKNDQFIAADVAVEPGSSGSVVYVSGKFNGVGKIYRSDNGGSNFTEIYSEVTQNIGVQFVAVSPQNKNQILSILEGGAVIRSTDGGKTWQRARNFDDTPVALGFVSEGENRAFAVFRGKGFYTSTDAGAIWMERSITRTPDSQTNSNNTSLSPATPTRFNSIEKVTQVGGTADSWLIIADRQMWYTQSLDTPFTQLLLPLQNERYNLLDVTADPQKGLDRLLASVDNKLFTTTNRGQSWSTGDQIQLSSPIGNIGQILIDRNNTNVTYLMLVDPSASRGSGLFGGF